MSQDTDSSNAIVHPPVAWALALVAGLGADWFYPLRFVPPSISGAWAGGAIFAIGFALAIWAIVRSKGRLPGRSQLADDDDRHKRTLPLHTQPYLSRHVPRPGRPRYRLQQSMDPRRTGAILSRHSLRRDRPRGGLTRTQVRRHLPRLQVPPPPLAIDGQARRGTEWVLTVAWRPPCSVSEHKA